MEKDWGRAPGSVMVDGEGSILVPGVMDGHVFITVQAPRGYGFDAAKIYHDPLSLLPISIWPITCGYGISGRRMPSFMSEPMEIWNGCRARARDLT